MILRGETEVIGEETCSSSNLSTTNPTTLPQAGNLMPLIYEIFYCGIGTYVRSLAQDPGIV